MRSMLLSTETRRSWWLAMLATWGVCAGLVLLHTAADREYIALLDGLGLRDAPEPTTPLRQVIPARYADAQMWVRHALAATEAGEARVRFTTVDNAPIGREVHWSSGFLGLLRGAAAVHQTLTGQSGALALERSLLWLNAPLLLTLMVLLSAWAGARAGAGAGIVVALAMVGHNRFYEGFTPANVDHHGLVNAALLGLLLGVAFMGAGWWQAPASGPGTLLPRSRPPARRAAILSGLCGATGLWLSAAAVVPIIAIVGLAGLGVTWWVGPAAQRDGAVFDPSLWRLWGRVGAGAALLFYLLEYAPSHFSLRLEVNHPLYALAWWGGAEIVAQIAAWRLGQTDTTSTASRFRLASLIGPLVAVAAVPLTILLAGPAAFLVSDPFVGALRHFVAEGRSTPAFVRQFGIKPLLFDLSLGLMLVPAFFVVLRGRGASRIVVGVLALAVATLLTMAFFEVRWGRTAGAAQIVLLLGLAAVAAPRLLPRWRLWAALAAAGLLLAPALQRIAVARDENNHHRVAAGDLLQPLYRDIAATLRASQPEGDIILLANPNASAGISYFGRFQSLGTLYWENAPGLRAAAEIYSAASDDEALALIRTRRITHLAMLSTTNFLGEYHRLLHPGATADAAKQSIGYRLASRLTLPRWLQPVPYRPPADLRDTDTRVHLYKVSPAQTEVEWLYHTALARLAEGDVAGAEKTLEAAVARATAAGRPALWEAGGAACYDYGADAAAVRMFRRALAQVHDSRVALTTAWILATSRDATVRDGIAALALAEPALRQAPTDPTAWSALAAAHAELGRFNEALAAAERAVAIARATGDAAALTVFEKRLATFRAGQPWRQ